MTITSNALQFNKPIAGSHEYTKHGDLENEVIFRSLVLNTEVYIKEGFIDETNLDDNGVYIDEYVKYSKYFYHEEGDKQATARQIRCHGKAGILSLPTFKKFNCYPEQITKAYGVEDILDIETDKVVEISALSSKKSGIYKNGSLDGVVSLYGDMLRESAENGHKLWVMNIEERLAKHLRKMIGEDLVVKIGDEKEYMGPATTPYAINPEEVLLRVLSLGDPRNEEFKSYIKGVFDGIKSKKMNPELVQKFIDNGVEIDKSGDVLEKFKSPVLLGTVAIAAFSTARPLAVSHLDEFDGSGAVLWGIDVATAYPYVKGIAMAYGNGQVSEKVIGAGIAIPSFVAPYAYFYANGEDYPMYVNIIVGGFVMTALAKEVISRKRKSSKRYKLITKLKK